MASSKKNRIVPARLSRLRVLTESLERRWLLSGTWTALTNTAPGNVQTMELLTNGQVLTTTDGDGAGNDWGILTPTATGSYVGGSWTKTALANDTRLFDATQVLQNGNVFVAGGEDGSGNATGEFYNPLTNVWTLAPAQPYGNMADAMSTLIPNGNVLILPVSPDIYAGTTIYNPTTNSWSQGPQLPYSFDADEQGGVTLPDGSFLTVWNNASERYIPAQNKWITDAALPASLSDSLGEYGVDTLLPNGKALFIGSSGISAIYTPSGSTSPGSWVAGPSIPGGLGEDDASGAMLRDGTFLITAGPAATFNGPTSFFIYNPTTNAYTSIAGPDGDGVQAFATRMLALPNGDVLYTDCTNQLYQYDPGTTAIASAVPTITSVAPNSNGSLTLTGTNLNGINVGAVYGDDAQMNTNYPLVRLTSGTNVYYARTYNWSNTGVMLGSTSETVNFTLPLGIPAGTYSLVAVANGVPSTATSLTISTTSGNAAPTIATAAASTPAAATGKTVALSVLGADDGGESNLTYTWVNTAGPSGALMPSFSTNGTNAAKNVTATFYALGTYSFKVVVTDAGGLSVTSTVNVSVSPTLTSMSVSPSPTNLTTGQSQQFTATGYDQFGNRLNSQPTFTWALATGGGTLSSSGLYTAPGTGTLATVTATTGSFSQTITIGVVNSPWTSTDIGSPLIGGYAYDSGSVTTLTGSGGDITGTSDQFHFDYQTITGNAAIVTQVTSLPATGDTGAQAGLMFRTSSAANASYVDLVNTTSQGIYLSYRNGTGASAGNVTYIGTPSGTFYLKLARINSNFIASYSTNGTTWTQLGICTNPAFTGAALAGLAVSSNSNSTLASASFTNTVISQPAVATAASATPGTVTGTTTNLSVLGANPSASAGESSLTYTWAATSIPAGAAAPTFSVNGTNAAKNTTATFFKIGSYTFTVTITDNLGQSVTSAFTVTVSPTFASIAVAPPTSDLNQSSTETLLAAGDDQFGATLSGQPTITWTDTTGIGAINPATGVFTSSTTSGTAIIKATSGSVSQTATIVVIPTAASPMPTVATAAAAITGVTTATLSVLGADDTGETGLTYTWAVTTLPTGATAPTFSINGTNAAMATVATFAKAGAYTFSVTITDSASHSVASSVSVAVNQVLSSLAVTPSTVTLDQNSTLIYAASGLDQFGNALAVAPAIIWSSTGIGVINGAGVYTAPGVSGSATILATSGTVTQTATVTVSSAALLFRVNASDYNSGVLRDDVGGLTANPVGSPTITANDTPSGKSAFTFNGGNSFNLTAIGPRTQNETIFAVVKPSASMTALANGGSIIGGSDNNNSVEYRLIENSQHTGLVQQMLETGVVSEGLSTTTISTSAFTIVELVLNEDTNVSNFYTNGVLDSSTGAANNLANGPTRIGARQTGGSGTTEYFIGDIAEVDIYNYAISATDSASIEAQLAAEYLTPAAKVLTSIVVTPGAANPRENATQTFSAIGYDQFGLALSPQPVFTWSDTGVGSINSATGVYTAPATTGLATIKATSGSVSQSATISVTHGIPTIATAAAASPVTGATSALSVLGADSGGESSLLYTWTATTLPTGASQPTFSIDGTNAAKNTTATFYAAGTYIFTVAATDNEGAGTATSSVSVTVNQTLTSIIVTPSTANLHENTAQTFLATADDQFGLPLFTQPSFTWAVTSGIGAINSSTGVYTAPAAAGTATVLASSAGVHGTANVSVSNAVPTVATAASATPNPATGRTTALSVLGADDGGESNLTYSWAATALPIGATAPLFSVNGTNAAKNTTATYSSAGGYTFTVTITDAQGNSVTSAISVAVNATLTTIIVTPATVTMDESTTQNFSATGYDQFGALLAIQPVFTWSETGGGSINSSTGIYTAAATAASVLVKATSGTVSQTATVTVNSPALVYRITASDYNTTTGVLRDEVAGLTANREGTPTVTINDTPSGASAITFNGSNAFDLTSTGPWSQNQTIFAVIKPNASMNSLANGGAILGGVQVTSVEYRLIENNAGTGLVEQEVRTNTQNLGNGTNLISTSGFSIVEMVLNQDTNVSTFYDYGIVDPSTGTANTISTGATRIGARQASGSSTSEFFIGDIAEIDIYNAALSSTASAGIESQLSAEYLTTTTTLSRQLTSIVVTPVASNLHEDAVQNFTAVGYDQFGVALATQPIFNWSVSGIGSINSATGVYTAPAAAGNAVVQVSSGAITQTAAITITNAAPTVATAAAATPGTVTGTSTALSVLGADDAGQSGLTYTWTATSVPAGATVPTFSINGTNAAQNTTATFYQAGAYTFTATISDGQGKSVTSSVNVTVSQTLSSIIVTPGTVNVGETATQPFSATADDQFGMAMVSQPVFVWSNTGVGSINSSSGVYTAPGVSGTAIVKATSGGVTGTANVTVNSSVPTSFNGSAGSDTYAIRLSPADSTIEQIFVNTPETGTPTYTIAISQIPSLSFTTANDGMLTVDFANGNPLPANGVSFSGGNELLIAGSASGGLGFAINAAQVTDIAGTSSPITYSNVQTVAFNLSGGSNTLTQQAQPQAILVFNAGPGNNTLNVNGGSLSFSADPQLTSGNLTVNETSSVVFSAAPVGGGYAARNLSGLNLVGTATATLTASTTATDRTVLVLSTLSVAGGSTLDVGNNALIVHDGNLSTITSLVQTGYNAAWTGTGIISSSAASDLTRLTTLGVIPNTGNLYSTFDGVAVVSTDVLLKDTYFGDANLDGKVDSADYSRIDNGYLNQGGPTPLTGWFNGDFNYDGVINGSDYTLIDNAFNTQSANLAAIAAIANQAPSVKSASPAIEVNIDAAAGVWPDRSADVNRPNGRVALADGAANFAAPRVRADSKPASFSTGETIRMSPMRSGTSAIGSSVLGPLVTSSVVAKPGTEIFSDIRI